MRQRTRSELRHGRLPARGLVAAGLAFGLACATADNPRVVSPYSSKLSPFNFKDEGSLVLLVVGTQAAQYNVKEKYFPLFVTLANKGAPTLRVTRESFSFEDSLGKRYSPLPLEIIEAEYHRGGFDRNLFRENYQFIGTSVERYTPIPSNFYPSVTRGIVHDDIQLPRFGYMSDLLYFPVPEEGILGGPFHLSFKTPELQEAVVVTFVVGKEPLP
ncbi:MAG TPA: hypothetical protein VGR67_01610 [Candidatus Polarisedimenticolia bacterium]|nr:hypothetical protein [Candidatus Polarisedimenticolia bacterium]